MNQFYDMDTMITQAFQQFIIICNNNNKMDCHHLFYKPIKSLGPYDRYIAKQKQKQITQKKQLFYSQILKFTSSRYPKQFLLELQNEINPFQHSLQTLRNIILNKYPDLPEDVVNESVQYVFGKKSREATMIRQSETVIQGGDQFIRNGRKLIKQDFTYNFIKPLNQSLPLPDTSRSRSRNDSPPQRSDRAQTKRSNTIRQQNPETNRKKSQDNQQSDRGPLSTQRKNMFGMSKNQLFNSIIAEEIQKQSNRYKNIQVIYEDDPEDILVKEQFTKKPGFTDRSAKSGIHSQSFNFKQRDIVVPIEGGIETGRSEVEELNNMLQEVTMKCEQKDGQTERSDRGMFMMKISKKNMENLYSMRGSLKLDTIKRAANRMINEYE